MRYLEVERLRNLLALADEALMLSHGCFPLDDGPLRHACLLIRAETGDNYEERRAMARAAFDPKANGTSEEEESDAVS